MATVYLTYDDYTAMGGAADPVKFERMETKSRRLIDKMTHGRIRNEDPVRRVVKMCMFEMISCMAADEAMTGAGGREVTAVSNDGVSMTYASQGEGGTSKRMAAIVKEWLDGESTPDGINLLYCGVDA